MRFGVEHQDVLLPVGARSQYKGNLKVTAVGPYNVLPVVLSELDS